MPDHYSRRDLGYLVDILVHSREAVAYAQGVSREAFLEEGLTTHAVMYCLLIIGEASKSLSDQVRSDLSQVDWASIAKFRDLAIHHYERTNYGQVWRIVQDDLPLLVAAVEPHVPPQESP